MMRSFVFLAALCLLSQTAAPVRGDEPAVDQLQQQAQQAADLRDAAEAKRNDFEARFRELELTLAKLKSDLDQTQRGLTENEAGIKAQQEEAAKAAAAKVEAEKATEATTAALAEAQKKVDEAKAAAAAASQSAEAAALALKQKEDAITAQKTMLASLQTSVAQSGEQLVTLQASLQAANQEAEAIRADWLAKARAVEAALTSAGQWVSFSAEVAPVLQDRCLACHNARASKGRLNVESYAGLMKGGESGDVISASDLENSNLHSQVVDGSMPKDADPLTPEQIAVIGKWISLGAKLDAGVDPNAPLLKIMPKRPQPAAPEVYTATLPVTAVAFSPDGQILATGGYHELLLWNAADHAILRRIGNVAERVFDIAFSPDGGMVAVAAGTPGSWGELKVFQTSDGALLADLVTTDDAMFGVAFSPDGTRLAGCGADRSLSVYDVATWQRQFRLEDHADWVLDIAWSPDGAKLVTASRDKTSKVFDAKSGDALTTFNSHGDVVFSAGFLADNASVVSAGRDKRLRVWKATDAAQIREIGGFGGDVLRIEILPEDKVLSAGGDMHVRLHNAADGAQIRDFAGHQDWVYAVGAHPGTNRIASGSYDGEVRLWNLENGELVSQWIAAPGFQTQQAAAK